MQEGGRSFPPLRWALVLTLAALWNDERHSEESVWSAGLEAATCVAAPSSGNAPIGKAGPLEVQETCSDAACCPAQLEQVIGTAAQDHLKGGSRSQCLVGLGGNDTVDGKSSDDIFVLGDGDDVARGSSGRDVFYGNAGNDDIDGSSHADTMLGGPGNDVLDGGSHDDLIVPGPDRDIVRAGSGDDTVVIRDLCEVTAGESYDGQLGTDTLVTPVSAADLASLGVSFVRFEKVEVDASLGASSTCGACGCKLVDGHVECCSGHGTCDNEIDPIRTVCDCEAGFTGDDCSLECGAGEPCEARIYRNGDGTTAGLAVGGIVLFDETGADESLNALREFVAAHPALFTVAPLTAADLDGISFVETVTVHGLRLHRYTQRYRGLPIHGPGSEISIVTAEERGAISVIGTIVDPRVAYLGTEHGFLCEGPAAQAMLTAWAAQFPADNASLGPLELVAVPSRRTLAYRATVRVDGADAGSVLVSAAAENGGTVLGVFDGRETLAALGPIDVFADDWTLWPGNAASDAQATLFSDLRDGDGTASLFGNTIDPAACGAGAAGCWLLTDDQLYVYDLNGQGPDANLGGSYVLPVSTDATFDASVGTLPYRYQNLYHKLRSAMLVAASLKECQWDWTTQWGVDRCVEPQVLAISNIATNTFGGRYRGPETIGPLLFDAGQVDPAWASRFFVPQQNSDGDPVAPARLEINGGNGTSTYYHEFGHHLDWFSGHGIGGVIGDMMSTYVPAPGCTTPSSGCCRPNTSDEALCAAETIGELWNLYFGRKLHSEIAQGQAISLLSSIAIQTHSPGASPPVTFAVDRPGASATSPQSGCQTGPGYKQRGIAQAFWEFADGLDCGAGLGVPAACAMLTQPVDPDGNDTAHVDVAGQAFQYALAKQPSSGGSYQQLFDDMGEYVECIFGQTVFAGFQSVFAHHGINVFAPVPRQCPPICGNGVLEGAEECDGADLGGTECTDLGHPGGTLGCTAGCAFDESNCSVCGNGIAEDGEQCDMLDLGGADCDAATGGASPFGVLQCTGSCDFDVASCSDCEPGSVGCQCLDEDNPGENNSDLPQGGIFGDGRYCLDDVSLGGEVRCLDPSGAEPDRCVQCTVGEGVWCPCVPQEGCNIGQDFSGPATGEAGDTFVCEAACDPDFPDICDASPAGDFGYCFVQGEADPLAGGVPQWFFDQYCRNVDSQLQCVQELGEPRFCQTDPGPACTPQ